MYVKQMNGAEEMSWVHKDGGRKKVMCRKDPAVHLKLEKSMFMLAIQSEYEVPLFQFVCGLILTMEEAKDRQVDKGMGWRIEVAINQEFHLPLADRAQVLGEVVA